MYWVYVIPVNGGLKVGHSKNPATRLHCIQSFSAQRLTFAVKRRFKSRRSALDLERLVHRIHGDRRIRGEWFGRNETQRPEACQ